MFSTVSAIVNLSSHSALPVAIKIGAVKMAIAIGIPAKPSTRMAGMAGTQRRPKKVIHNSGATDERPTKMGQDRAAAISTARACVARRRSGSTMSLENTGTAVRWAARSATSLINCMARDATAK
jgi:hypothetical protein